MKSVINTWWIFVISSVLDETYGAHECFQCRSDQDKRCADRKPPAIYRKPCLESSRDFCRKSTFRLYFTDQTEPVTVRECVNRRLDDSGIEEGCYLGRYTRDSHSLTCECRGDCCNGTHLSTQPSVFPLYYCVLLYLIVQLAVP